MGLNVSMATVLVISPEGEPIAPLIDALRRNDHTPFSITKLRKKDEWRFDRWDSRFAGKTVDRALYQVKVLHSGIGTEESLVMEASSHFLRHRFYLAPSNGSFQRSDARMLSLIEGGSKAREIVVEPNVPRELADSIQEKCWPLGVTVSSGTNGDSTSMVWDNSYEEAWSREPHHALERALQEGNDPKLTPIDWAPILTAERLSLWKGAMEIATKMGALAQQLVLSEEDDSR